LSIRDFLGTSTISFGKATAAQCYHRIDAVRVDHRVADVSWRSRISIARPWAIDHDCKAKICASRPGRAMTNVVDFDRDLETR
jgi:hypothetical protein